MSAAQLQIDPAVLDATRYINSDGIRWARRQVSQHRLGHTILQQLLEVMGEMAGPDGNLWPSQGLLGSRIGRSVRQVYRYLRRLARLGLIGIRERIGRYGLNSSNEYTLLDWEALSTNELLSDTRKNVRAGFPPKIADFRSDIGVGCPTNTPEIDIQCVSPPEISAPTSQQVPPPPLPPAAPSDARRRAARAGGGEPSPAPTSSRPRKTPDGAPTPLAMLEAWNEIVRGTPLPPAQMNGRHAGQLAHIVRHPILTQNRHGDPVDPAMRWQHYCEWLTQDPFYRGDTRRAGPITLAEAATDIVLEKAQAAARAEQRPQKAINGHDRRPSPIIEREPEPSFDELCAQQPDRHAALLRMVADMHRDSDGGGGRE